MSETQTTLRDTISNAFDEIEKTSSQDIQTPGTNGKNEPIVDTPTVSETAEQKAERIRDEKGRFAPGKPEAKEAKVEQVASPETKRPQRPSSWKKDYWEQWDKLDPKLAEYISQREQEYARGVSTYKKEWDNAKPLLDAMSQFAPILQQHNISPVDWITNLGHAHRILALGNPQQKLQMFQKLAQDYGIPLQGLIQSMNGQTPSELQYVNPLYEKISQLEGKLNSWQTEREQQEQLAVNREIEQFKAGKEHFEQVRETMAGLLQAGLATDLNDAYEKSVRLSPDIFEAFQSEQSRKVAEEQAMKNARMVQSAKAKAVSPRSNTPVGLSSSAGSKGLRSTLESAFDEHMNDRV